MKIGLALLNRNEVEALPHFLPKLDLTNFDAVFVVDGGSSDGSREVLLNNHFKVIDQESKGRGQAFSIAFQEAKRLELDALVFISTDGNEDPDDLPKFIQGIINGFDLVIASRMLPGSRNEEDDSLFRPRKAANKLFAYIAYFMFSNGSPRLTDPINGFRAMSVDAWNKMNLDYSGYDIEFATSIQAYRFGMRVLEFPTFEGDRLGGKSGARAIPTTLAMFGVLNRMRKLGKNVKRF
jgi:glycosyltransferase involved in cell wall biosynthesis